MQYNPNEIRLKNNTKLILLPGHKDDLICLNLFLPVGIETECLAKGIGSFTCSMLLAGTNKYSKEELAFNIERLGVMIDWSRTHDFINYSIIFNKQYMGKALQLFFNLLLTPAFPEQEIKRKKQEFVNAIQSRHDHIFNVCYDFLLEKLFGKNYPYSWLTLGSIESINNIQKQDILNFHKNYFILNNAIISVCGNTTAEELKTTIEPLLPTKAPLSKNIYKDFIEDIPPISLGEHTKIQAFNQAYIMRGYIAPSIQDEHYINTRIINSYIGSGMASKMFTKIRDQLGLVYEISSFYLSRKHTSAWILYLGLSNNNIEQATKAIEQEIANIIKCGIASKELNKIKTKLQSAHFMDHQTKLKKSYYLGLWEILGLGWEYDSQYIDQLNAATTLSISKTLKNLFTKTRKVQVIIRAHQGKSG